MAEEFKFYVESNEKFSDAQILETVKDVSGIMRIEGFEVSSKDEENEFENLKKNYGTEEHICSKKEVSK